MIMFLIIYLTGLVPGYIFYKKYSNKANKGLDWTVGDRNFGMFCALFSWVGVLNSIFLMWLIKPGSRKKSSWAICFPILLLASCSPTAPVRVIEVEATWQPQQGSAPMTMDVQLTINRNLTGYGNVSWQYEYEELVPPYRKGTAVRLHQYTATNGVINVINTMDIVNPATILICGFKLLSVTVNTNDVMIVKNKNYVPCGKY